MRTLQGRMLAMLTWARLPLTYWGEAALTASYLQNLSLQSALPPNVTPHEMYHGRKPDISHLRVFGARAFAHVPLKMQTKLGVKSRECLFMGYPPGQKGYRVRDLATSTFFTSTAVIFDENSPYAPLHDTSPIATPLDVGGPIPELRNLNSSSAHPPDPPRRSSRSLHLTAAGKAQAARITAAKIHLEDVREAARLRIQPTESSDTEGTIALLTHPAQLSSEPENSIFSCYLPSLELAFMSIRSSEHRNPTSHDYDLTTPPYNYNEAIAPRALPFLVFAGSLREVRSPGLPRSRSVLRYQRQMLNTSP
jgi:hypothetical protein